MKDITKLKEKKIFSANTKSSRVILPEVYDTKKILDTNILPEKQRIVPQNKKVIDNKLRLD